MSRQEEQKEYEKKLNEIENGINLDKHIKDNNWGIRAAVARSGYGLEELANDENEVVRQSVVEACNPDLPEHRIILDKLIKDKSYQVRSSIAKKEYRPEVLVKDRSTLVRMILASRGHKLDILINDKSKSVRETAERRLRIEKQETVTITKESMQDLLIYAFRNGIKAGYTINSENKQEEEEKELEAFLKGIKKEYPKLF